MNLPIYQAGLLQCNDLYKHEYYVLSYHAANDNTMNQLIPEFVLPFKYEFHREFFITLRNKTRKEYSEVIEDVFLQAKDLYAVLLFYRKTDKYSKILFRTLKEAMRVLSGFHKYLNKELAPALDNFIEARNCISKTFLKSIQATQVLINQFMRYNIRFGECLECLINKADVNYLQSDIEGLISGVIALAYSQNSFSKEIESVYKELTDPVRSYTLN